MFSSCFLSLGYLKHRVCLRVKSRPIRDLICENRILFEKTIHLQSDKTGCPAIDPGLPNPWLSINRSKVSPSKKLVEILVNESLLVCPISFDLAQEIGVPFSAALLCQRLVSLGTVFFGTGRFVFSLSFGSLRCFLLLRGIFEISTPAYLHQRQGEK